MRQGLEGATVLGGGLMRADEYAQLLADEYLTGYLPAGGGSVKLVVAGDADVAGRFAQSLQAAAHTASCRPVSVSAESTKVHMIDHVFFAVARQVDWDQVAATIVKGAYDTIGTWRLDRDDPGTDLKWRLLADLEPEPTDWHPSAGPWRPAPLPRPRGAPSRPQPPARPRG